MTWSLMDDRAVSREGEYTIAVRLFYISIFLAKNHSDAKGFFNWVGVMFHLIYSIPLSNPQY